MMSLRRPGTFLLASLLITCVCANAQDDRPQRDTAASDTVVVGGEQGNSGAANSDSTYDTGVDSAVSASDSILARSVSDSVVQRWKKAPEFAYANDPHYWKRMPQENGSTPGWFINLLGSDGFRYGVYIILGALLLYAIGRIVTENQLGVFYRGAKRSGGSGKEAVDAPAEEDIDGLLKQSVENKDYRKAVRYSYLRTLRRLDKRGLIQFHGQSTNQEYMHQLNGTVQEGSFRFLTYAYEKVWYGEFGLSDESFRRLFGYFTEFDKTIDG